MPEVVVLNSVGESADLALADNKYRVQVHANGLVVWMPGLKFRTTCKVDLTNFPFDTQTCYINITSWLYPTHFVHLNVGDDTVKMDYMESNGAWDVEKATASRFTIETDMGSMSVISCAVELRRKPKYYIMHLIMPAVTMSTVSIFVFALPVESGEKISLGISVLISYSVITLLVADNMPTNGDTIPVLSVYINFCMTMTAISIMITVAILNIHHRSVEVAVPTIVRVLVIDFLGRILLKTPTFASGRGDVKPEKVLRRARHTSDHRSRLSRHDRSTTPERNNHSGRPKDRVTSRRGLPHDPDAEQKCEVLDHSVQWRLAASILDRFFLVVYLVALICVTTWTGIESAGAIESGRGIKSARAIQSVRAIESARAIESEFVNVSKCDVDGGPASARHARRSTDVLSLDVLSVDVLSLDVLSLDVLSLDVLSLDVLSLDVLSLDVPSLRLTWGSCKEWRPLLGLTLPSTSLT
ncbi:Neuronal acetylcholine receptor subunit alpha-6 [Lamellibrachia satsuma]|nr:Neuronal acetylcholine receptor subunit alpha-6 [Lamellibrachia satsuma]